MRVLLAVRPGEQHDADPRHDAAAPCRARIDHRGVLDHRVGEEAGAHVLDLGPGRRLVGGLEAEADRLADPHALHAVEAEVGQRALDGLPLRVGHAFPQTDLHLHVELHGPTLAHRRGCSGRTLDRDEQARARALPRVGLSTRSRDTDTRRPGRPGRAPAARLARRAAGRVGGPLGPHLRRRAARPTEGRQLGDRRARAGGRPPVEGRAHGPAADPLRGRRTCTRTRSTASPRSSPTSGGRRRRRCQAQSEQLDGDSRPPKRPAGQVEHAASRRRTGR